MLTLFVRYKLNSSGLHGWTSLILVHFYLMVTIGSHCYIKWYYLVIGNMLYGSSLMSQLDLTIFRCVTESYVSPFNYSLGIIILALFRYMSFSYILSGWNNTIFLTPNYWTNHLNYLSCDVSSYVLKNLLNLKQISCHLQVVIPFKSYLVWCWLYYIC